MRPTLTKDEVYNSVHYGLVKYEGTCSTNRGGAGFCYKFSLVNGQVKYVDLGELSTFLMEHEYAM